MKSILIVICLLVSIVSIVSALSIKTTSLIERAKNVKVESVKFTELKSKISNSEKVLVVQIYLKDVPEVSMFEKVALMYGNAIEFVRTDLFAFDSTTMKEFVNKTWDINGKHGQFFVFDNETLIQSTVQNQTNEVFKFVNNAFENYVKRQLD